MELQINKFNFHQDDHCWVEETQCDEYINNTHCEGCGGVMTEIVRVQNDKGIVGIAHGLCESCGYIKATRNLKSDVLDKHFSKKWLNMRTFDDFKVVDSVYKILEPYIDKKTHKRVLDVGCGNGDKLSYFEREGYETFGIEPSQTRTDAARKYLKKSNIKTGFAKEYLEEVEQGFDIIYIENVLQFTDNPFLLFDLAASKLNKGGLLYIRAQRFDYSSFSMFSMLSLIRSYVSLYTLKSYIIKNKLNIAFFSSNPFVLVMKKDEKLNDKTVEILENAPKVNFDEVKKAAQAEFSSKLSGLTKSVTIKKKSMKRSMHFKILSKVVSFPIKIISNNDKLPIILK